MGATVRASARTRVVVLNYRGGDHIAACLASLQTMRSPPGGHECVVVDNASDDGSVEIVQDRFPNVEIVENEVNLGYVGGNNRGIRDALDTGADYVAVLNVDAQVEEGWLDALVRQADEAENAAILGSLILSEDGTEVEFDGRQFDPVTTSGGYADRPVEDGEREAPPREVPYACGAAMLLRAEALREVGLFDPVFFAYHEDVDLAIRCWLSGWRVMLVPGSVVRHARGGAGAGVGFRDFMGGRNSVLTILKTFDGHSWERHAEALLGHFLMTDDELRRRAALTALHRAPEILRHRRHLMKRAERSYSSWAARFGGAS